MMRGMTRRIRYVPADPLPEVALLPHEPGVYRFRDERGRALDVGRAVDLRRRVRSYWGDLHGRAHLRRMVPRVARIEAAACASEHEAAWLERNLLERSMPPWNRTAGGQEVPVYLRLDDGTVTPGLHVTYRVTGEMRHFGPYLGGTRVRLAVAAVHRVLPLRYAAARLTGAEREMAAVRGFAGADRSHVLARAAALLRRDPATVAEVRTELVERRDAAAGAS